MYAFGIYVDSQSIQDIDHKSVISKDKHALRVQAEYFYLTTGIKEVTLVFHA